MHFNRVCDKSKSVVKRFPAIVALIRFLFSLIFTVTLTFTFTIA